MGDQEKDNPASRFQGIHSVEDNTAFSHKERKAQRVFKIILFLFLAAVLLGLFGGGLWGRKTVIINNNTTITFDRFAREETPAKLTIYLKNPGDTTQISFNSSYIKNMKVAYVIPSAIGAKTSEGRISYLFNTGVKSLIIFYLIPQSAGARNIILGVNSQTIYLNQFIYF